MKKIKIILWLFAILITVCLLTYAQSRNDDSQKKQQTNASQKNGNNSIMNNEFERLGIKQTHLNKLEQIGVNLREYKYYNGIYDERIDAALKEFVIIGKVLNIVDVPGEKAKPYHSKVNIQILEVLKGRSQSDTIQLLREDGPITDGPPGAYLTVTHSANFSAGETSVFFLNNIYNDPYFTSRYKSSLSKGASDIPNPTYWVRPIHKHQIVDSIVNYHGRMIPLAAFKSNVEKIVQILNEK